MSELGGGKGGRASAWFTVVAGGKKEACAMHPSFSCFHWMEPVVEELDMVIVAGPNMPGFPTKISPPIKHW